MRWFLYNILFAIGYTLMLPKFFLRMRRRGGYRADFGQRLGRFAPEVAARLAEKPRVWIHAVSVGEANLAGAVLREFLQEQAGGGAFAHQPALHVGETDDDGVDLFRVDELTQLLDGEISCCHADHYITALARDKAQL